MTAQLNHFIAGDSHTVNGIVTQAAALSFGACACRGSAARTRELPCPVRFSVSDMPRGMGNLGPELRRLAEMAGLSNKSLARAKAHRVGSLRGYGNAINYEQAVTFIHAAFGGG